MRILQIGSSLYSWGGIERYVDYLGRGLADRGHEVWLTAPAGSPLAVRWKSNLIEISQESQFSLKSVGDYKDLFREGQFDVAHVHFSPDFVVPIRIARRYSGAAIVLTRHLASTWPRFKAWAYGSTVDRFVAVSEATRRSLVASGIPESRVTVAHAGCESIGTAAPSHEDGTRSRFRVGFFGRLTIEKGVDVLIEAIRALPSTFECHIFGDGPHRQSLESGAECDRVHFHGYIENVAERMSTMDCIVAPSRWAEAFPFSVLESMSVGVPVVASNVGGIPEQIESGVSGILVPPEDPMALAEAIASLMAEPDLSRRLGEEAKRRQNSEFTIAKFAERIEAVYEVALAQRNLRRG